MLRQAIEQAVARHRSGHLAEAEAMYRQVLAAHPDLAEVRANLAHTLEQQSRFEDAIRCYREALAARPDSAEILSNLGNALRAIGELDEAIACYRRSLMLKPVYATIHDTLLCTLLYSASSSPGEILSAHRRYAELFEAPLRPSWPSMDGLGDRLKSVPILPFLRRDPLRRLKIGYVSPDFYNHSVAYFIEPILSHHDRSQFEVFAYYNGGREDQTTGRLRSSVDRWRSCVQLSDEQLADRIRADEIDVLVDLAGHTAGNRLLTFARKPAPVQVTYLGYPTTTGLTAIDYRLTASDVDPEGSEAYHSERLFRLPRTLWCYRPAENVPATPATTPALAKGHVTFGSMNNFQKLSPPTIALWSTILHSLPGSRLVITNLPGEFAGKALRARFNEHGISPDRLTLHDLLPADRFRLVANEIDIALDPFPYNGTTTTCEALWKGIPVVSLIGKTSVDRSGYALLKTAGLGELCARDQAEYVKTAVSLAQDTSRLDALRRGMRSRIEASPLRDEAAMAKDVEEAYRTMWRRWT